MSLERGCLSGVLVTALLVPDPSFVAIAIALYSFLFFFLVQLAGGRDSLSR